jgi:zinc-binding alcohol dehydrogenase/oxidoreductase
MKAVLLTRHGTPQEALQVTELADPEPGPGEAVVALEAAALNRREVWMRETPGSCEPPVLLGSDGAGRVHALGEGAHDLRPGEEVVIDPTLFWGEREDAPAHGWQILGAPWPGTYAELVRVPAENVRPKPARLSFAEAAALPLGGVTAWRALFVRGRLEAGQTVLVTGAGSGVAGFLVQLAASAGARVLVTSSSQRKIERARELGAEGGALYTEPDWPKQIGRVDLAVDSAGGASFEGALRCLRRGGTLVNFGRTSADEARVDLARFFFGQWNLHGTTMGSPRDFTALLEHVAGADWRPVIDSTFPLEQAAAAHERLAEGDRFGKVVLQVR